jgi:hypothetical protein
MDGVIEELNHLALTRVYTRRTNTISPEVCSYLVSVLTGSTQLTQNYVPRIAGSSATLVRDDRCSPARAEGPLFCQLLSGA